jgi:hypothetical protein
MGKPTSVKFSDFPQVSNLPKSARSRAKELFEEAVSLKRMIAGYEKDLEAAIEELERVQKELALPGLQIEVDGVRWGFAYQQIAGRRGLSKVALMEKLGVTKKDLDRCMVQGEDYERRTLKEIKGEESAAGEGDKGDVD